MNNETIAITLTAAGVLIAFLAWRYPKAIGRQPDRGLRDSRGSKAGRRGTSSIGSPALTATILVTHLRETVHDSERLAFVKENAACFTGTISLRELNDALSIMVHDENKVGVVQALAGVVEKPFDEAEYERFVKSFVHGDNRHKAANALLK